VPVSPLNPAAAATAATEGATNWNLDLIAEMLDLRNKGSPSGAVLPNTPLQTK
jgi:hypothetical protein